MSYSEALTQELNDELQQAVAAGNGAARDRMIQGNMRLAATRVELFIARRPQFDYLKDDLLSEAFVGLTEAVDDISSQGVRENPTGWLSTCIDNQLRTAVESHDTIRVPRRTRDGNMARSRAIEDVAFTPDTEAVNEAREAAYACCENDTDRAIMQQREAGQTDAQIAESLGVTRISVTRARQRLYRTFKKI